MAFLKGIGFDEVNSLDDIKVEATAKKIAQKILRIIVLCTPDEVKNDKNRVNE